MGICDGSASSKIRRRPRVAQGGGRRYAISRAGGLSPDSFFLGPARPFLCPLTGPVWRKK